MDATVSTGDPASTAGQDLTAAGISAEEMFADVNLKGEARIVVAFVAETNAVDSTAATHAAVPWDMVHTEAGTGEGKLQS